ncbi:MAG: hypothetical protein ACLGJD_21380 [Gammaproteobacteria bacterium]|uniref:hypothetical protein n=1 Tax=Pseudacidovorax intermedius TaxID=433924 RepID=UPI001473D941|nr:hypothetical protein [Pseudacidovorax intermedius]
MSASLLNEHAADGREKWGVHARHVVIFGDFRIPVLTGDIIPADAMATAPPQLGACN